MSRLPRTLSIAAVLGSLAMAAPAAACDGSPLSRPFLPWLDAMQYAEAPGGDFEPGAPGWALAGGARVVEGNEPYKVGGSSDRFSLSLPAGGSATSPGFCAGITHPTVRLFAKGGGLLGSVRVDVLYTDGAGLLRSQSLGQVLPSATWQPTLPLATLSGLPLLTGSKLALRFTASGAGFAIDDVYVDPFRRT